MSRVRLGTDVFVARTRHTYAHPPAGPQLYSGDASGHIRAFTSQSARLRKNNNSIRRTAARVQPASDFRGDAIEEGRWVKVTRW